MHNDDHVQALAEIQRIFWRSGPSCRCRPGSSSPTAHGMRDCSGHPVLIAVGSPIVSMAGALPSTRGLVLHVAATTFSDDAWDDSDISTVTVASGSGSSGAADRSVVRQDPSTRALCPLAGRDLLRLDLPTARHGHGPRAAPVSLGPRRMSVELRSLT